MSESLVKSLEAISPVSLEAKQAIADLVKPLLVKKNDFILEQGKVCHYLYFIEKGTLRGSYNKEGKEVTHWLAFENGLATSFYSFISQKPGVESIQALEETWVLAIHNSHLNQWYKAFPETERLGRLMLERYYTQLEERLLSIQFEPAKERYNALVAKYPQILQRVSLGHLASYLGMTQETLSRVRAS